MKRLIFMVLPLLLRQLGKRGGDKGRGPKFDDKRMRQGVRMLRRFMRF